jgi:uncharacterized protein YjbJ (UPF0337 family)
MFGGGPTSDIELVSIDGIGFGRGLPITGKLTFHNRGERTLHVRSCRCFFFPEAWARNADSVDWIINAKWNEWMAQLAKDDCGDVTITAVPNAEFQVFIGQGRLTPDKAMDDDNQHYHTGAPADAKRHHIDDDHNHAVSRSGEADRHNDHHNHAPAAIIAGNRRLALPKLSLLGWGIFGFGETRSSVPSCDVSAAPTSFLSHIGPVLGRSRADFQRSSILLRPQKVARLQKRWPRKDARENRNPSFTRPGRTTKASTKDKLKGSFHEMKGTIKEGVGKVTNDPGLKAEGKAERKAGKVQQRIGDAKETVAKLKGKLKELTTA